MGDRSKGPHGVSGYSKTKGRDRLLSASIHTFLVGKERGVIEKAGPGGYFGGREIPVGGKRRKKIERKPACPA